MNHSTVKMAAPKRTVYAFIALFMGLCVSPTRADNNRSLPILLERIERAADLLGPYQPLSDVEVASDTLLRAWVQSLDPLAGYWSADEAAQWAASENGMGYEAGIEIAATNGAIVVSAIASNAQAAPVGLQIGDTIVAVDQAPTEGVAVEQVRSWLRLSTKRPLVLGVADASGSRRNVPVEPNPAYEPAVAAAETLPTGLPYLKLNGFYPQSEAEILSTMRRWIGQTNTYGLIMDLRGARGRDAAAAAAVVSAFSSEGQTLAAFRSVDDRELAVFRSQPGLHIRRPVMLLVDEQTRGAAEWFAAVIKGLGRVAMLIGSETRGDPLIREPVELPWNRVLFVVTRHLVAADGFRYMCKEKVSPHIVIPRTDEAAYEPPVTAEDLANMSVQEREDRALRIRVGRDAALRRAVELLQALRALDVGAQSE